MLWNLHYLGHPVKIGQHSFFVDSSDRLYTSALIENILQKLDNFQICAGEKFQVLSDNRQGIFNDHEGSFPFSYNWTLYIGNVLQRMSV